APLTISLVKVVGAQDFVSAGVTEELECSATGSRPPAQISWWRDGSHIANPNTKNTELANKTVSILRLSPHPSDHGVVLTCRVENPDLPSSTLEESYKLNVHYIPKVKLSPGMNLNPKSIREGTDVYFECQIVANPKFYKITWTHHGEPIAHNVSEGVIVTNQSLVLQRVGRERAGPYACRATNLQGEGISNSIELAIRCRYLGFFIQSKVSCELLDFFFFRYR
ncbi:B-cell receptor CD22-like, partial [Oratosquilla oratoria]|uniref:B-cell receptor CD22-like n=1 Tax=Oratosquilla oratoria TaxID=337810 RepID=UPI003F760152